MYTKYYKVSNRILVRNNKELYTIFTPLFVSAGFNSNLLITNKYNAWSWGNNVYGQLGDNTNINRSTPIAVCGNHTFAAISAGYNHSLAIDNTGKAWSWGYNYFGQLGDNTVTSKLTPVAVCNI